MKADPQAFVEIEEALGRKIKAAFEAKLQPSLDAIYAHVRRSDYGAAYQAVDRLDLRGIVESEHDDIEKFAVAAMLFGQSQVEGLDKADLTQPDARFPPQIAQAIHQLTIMLEWNVADTLRDQLRATILSEEREYQDSFHVVSLHKAFDDSEPRDATGKWTAIEGLPAGKVVVDQQMGEAVSRGAYKMTATPSKRVGRYDVEVRAVGGTPFKRDVYSDRQGYYDPSKAHLQVEDKGTEIEHQFAAPNNPDLEEIIPLHEKDVIYRGISAEEFNAIRASGEVKSKGDYNMGDAQKGLTYWSTQAEQAQSYAHGFAPWQFKATFDRPAYVIATKRPANTVAVAGTGAEEVGVPGAIKAADILAVWRGDVYSHMPGKVELLPRDYDEDSKELKVGSSSAPSAGVLWTRVKDVKEALKKYDEDEPREPDGKWTAVYHGTTASFDDALQPSATNYMLNNMLGVHVARDAGITDSFVIERVNGKDICPKPGGRVLKLRLDESKMLTVPQERYNEWNIQSDQDAIEKMIEVTGYREKPELFTKFLEQARNAKPEEAKAITEAMMRGEKFRDPVDSEKAYSLEDYARNFGPEPYNDEDRKALTLAARAKWQSEGYEGLKYENTSPMETAGVKDKTCFVVFDPKTLKSAIGKAEDYDEFRWLTAVRVAKYDDSEPRDNLGKWTTGVATSDPVEAFNAVTGGRPVTLHGVEDIPALVDHIHAEATTALANGAEAPHADLAKVNVAGTSLFAEDNLGIPRADMPQLNSDQRLPFIMWLRARDIGVKDESVPVASLHATQKELNGASIAGLRDRIKHHDGWNKPIFISSDNYILDGHHQWAARIAIDAEDGKLGGENIQAERVDAPIAKLLALADEFTGGEGKRDAKSFSQGPLAKGDGFDPNESRDADGEWTNTVASLTAKQKIIEGVSAALKDPVTGIVYSGRNHGAAYRTMPPDVQERFRGFLSDGNFHRSRHAGFVETATGKWHTRDDMRDILGDNFNGGTAEGLRTILDDTKAKIAALRVAKGDPDEPRDDQGQWTKAIVDPTGKRLAALAAKATGNRMRLAVDPQGKLYAGDANDFTHDDLTPGDYEYAGDFFNRDGNPEFSLYKAGARGPMREDHPIVQRLVRSGARNLNAIAALQVAKGDPDEPRDKDGKWTEGGEHHWVTTSAVVGEGLAASDDHKDWHEKGPRAFLVPAVKNKAGVVVGQSTGKDDATHGDVVLSLIQHKKLSPTGYTLGFTTPGGVFLNRSDAFKYAKANGLLDLARAKRNGIDMSETMSLSEPELDTDILKPFWKVKKDDLSTTDLEDTGGLLTPEQAGAPRKKKKRVLKGCMCCQPTDSLVEFITKAESDDQGDTLYVHRPVLNGDDLIAWAEEQGIFKTLSADDMHVTVCYSKTPAAGLDPLDTTMTVKDGYRGAHKFGDAVVLQFDSIPLAERNAEFMQGGATSDFPIYRSHVTISYDCPRHISTVQPYTGDIELGPEIFSPVDEDWVATKKAATDGMTLAQKLNYATLSGKTLFDAAANLTTTRLISFGFLSQAKGKHDSYQINEVLDDRTCPVCMFMHGKTFPVLPEYAKVLMALGTTDPATLKAYNPWPKQDKASIKALHGMSDSELYAASFTGPPFHPRCRGFLSLIGGAASLPSPDDLDDQAQEIVDGLGPEDAQVVGEGAAAGEAVEEAPATLTAALDLDSLAETLDPFKPVLAALQSEIDAIVDPTARAEAQFAFDQYDLEGAQAIVDEQLTDDEKLTAAGTLDEDGLTIDEAVAQVAEVLGLHFPPKT